MTFQAQQQAFEIRRVKDDAVTPATMRGASMKVPHAVQVLAELRASDAAFEAVQHILKGQGFFECLTHPRSSASMAALIS
ncbi:hypothetical protein GCM10007866_18540 [Gluconobacter albidus]|uniref:Uncharacterized protein n=1 Tax=Gluconobacter albidus TaxID=318683 RepID=A0ABQ5X1W1_9PROT|nr:hypothetical protein GCM10007866_18540 [Gluconobacter albidus]